MLEKLSPRRIFQRNIPASYCCSAHHILHMQSAHVQIVHIAHVYKICAACVCFVCVHIVTMQTYAVCMYANCTPSAHFIPYRDLAVHISKGLSELCIYNPVLLEANK